MAGEVLNMNELTLNKHRSRLKDLYFKTATKPYTHRCTQYEKIMKQYLLIIILFFIVFNVYSTAQYPDKIYFNGKEYSLYSNPLESYFEKNPEKRPKTLIISSALWRGYVATFEVLNNQLFLKDIEIQVKDTTKKSFDTKWKSVILETFPNQELVKVDWLTGLLVIPQGKLKNYVHLGYGSTYENYTLLEISLGNLEKEKHFRHAEYIEFREEQFKAYKKTEEYKELRQKLKKEGYSNKDVNSFLRSAITEYTSKILID